MYIGVSQSETQDDTMYASMIHISKHRLLLLELKQVFSIDYDWPATHPAADIILVVCLIGVADLITCDFRTTFHTVELKLDWVFSAFRAPSPYFQ